MLFDSCPRDLRAAIGPGIRSCCYKVGPELKEQFEGQFTYGSQLVSERKEQPSALEMRYPRFFRHFPDVSANQEHLYDTNIYLDLVEANLRQLRDAGLARSHIYADAPCTSCHPEMFFSHRRDEGITGRMMGVIGIRCE